MSMEINVKLDSKAPDYAMFTEIGNAAVHAVVEIARAKDMTWAQVCNALSQLAKQEQFGEATDTMVREYVYDALGFGNTKQSFYGA